MKSRTLSGLHQTFGSGESVFADLPPVFFFGLLVMTVELLMNQEKSFLFTFTTQDSVVTDAWKSFRKNKK